MGKGEKKKGCRYTLACIYTFFFSRPLLNPSKSNISTTIRYIINGVITKNGFSVVPPVGCPYPLNHTNKERKVL